MRTNEAQDSDEDEEDAAFDDDDEFMGEGDEEYEELVGYLLLCRASI
jgi:hypothetical protein